ncbi:hypothetical protein PHLCEN_2v7317 [Hermanssonia centrifuga]|uniref:Uncharacterized protein n=1 Tax=Hermanssonia centrifuga TaxID=98765 RepID=A0A2R6NWQ8_9APHY|nr:hypothetical protein PHLCEN_2v7317 [Hermanssonia centrifuga]
MPVVATVNAVPAPPARPLARVMVPDRVPIPPAPPAYQEIVVFPPAYTTLLNHSSIRNNAVASTSQIAGTRGIWAQTERERLVQEALENLRVNHECDHKRWKYRPGGGVCQTCSHRLPSYLFVSSMAPLSYRMS